MFCYIFLLCLSSCAHLSCRTPSFPACPEPALIPPRSLNVPLSLSVFSLSASSISLWHNMGQLSDRARDSSVLLTLSLVKSTWNTQTIWTPRVTHSIYKWNRIFSEENISYTITDRLQCWCIVHNKTRNMYYGSWFHEYGQLPILTLIAKTTRPWCCVSASGVIKCLSVRAVRHSTGLWNLLSAALVEVQIHVHTHNISLQICHAGLSPDRETLQELAVICQLLASALQLPVNVIRSIWTLSIIQLLLIKYVSYMLYYCMCGMRTRIIALSISGYTENF